MLQRYDLMTLMDFRKVHMRLDGKVQIPILARKCVSLALTAVGWLMRLLKC